MLKIIAINNSFINKGTCLPFAKCINYDFKATGMPDSEKERSVSHY